MCIAYNCVPCIKTVQRDKLGLGVCVYAHFLPISWEDDEPTSRAEILGEE